MTGWYPGYPVSLSFWILNWQLGLFWRSIEILALSTELTSWMDKILSILTGRTVFERIIILMSILSTYSNWKHGQTFLFWNIILSSGPLSSSTTKISSYWNLLDYRKNRECFRIHSFISSMEWIQIFNMTCDNLSCFGCQQRFDCVIQAWLEWVDFCFPNIVLIATILDWFCTGFLLWYHSGESECINTTYWHLCNMMEHISSSFTYSLSCNVSVDWRIPNTWKKMIMSLLGCDLIWPIDQ